uniref:Uncharacterized protein n=1 Tax=Rhizophora mucronata TaxID=61149 RepID=A0A2P2IZK2_RHIMU
MLKSLHQCHR